ncbi:hypothetical protein GPJ56_005756 [Histomonas meleagridis]|uniref:uncharacterized protein n=1 Tax=Histomonas meleagridis TaxID=135588 RepID=UPI00355AA392|nr:hypothetical protein GPJ56_005756 [Histomonas meleagridis]KAH0796156.1 hypothetical protein GO595_010049 [Histomonas meleagridis]
MFALVYLIPIVCEELIAFQSGINTVTYTETNAPSDVSFYTTNEKILVAITQIDKTKAKVQVEVPVNSNPQNYDKNAPLFFLSDNSKILVKFSQNSVIKFSTVTIPSGFCSSGVSSIVDIYSKNLTMQGSANNQDLCIFYATSEAKRKYNVISNNLQGNTRLTIFKQRINENAFDTFISDGKTGGIDSEISTPLLFRLTTTTSSDQNYGNITINLKSDDPSDMQLQNAFEGEPKRFKTATSEMKYLNDWWIPLLGSIAPIALLSAWIFTFLNLRKKEPIVVDEGLYDDLYEDEI